MVRPSNGQEGRAWMAAWCATCSHDADEDCPIALEGLLGGDPEQWRRGPLWSPQTVMYCTAYERTPQHGSASWHRSSVDVVDLAQWILDGTDPLAACRDEAVRP